MPRAITCIRVERLVSLVFGDQGARSEFQGGRFRLEAAHVLSQRDLVRTSICDKHSGSMKITTHLDYILHCKNIPASSWLKQWIYRVFVKSTLRDSIALGFISS